MHKLLGVLLILASFTIFALYTTWAILIPLDALAGFHELMPYLELFPEHKFASILPADLLLCAICFVVLFIVVVKMKEAAKKKVN